MSLTSDDIAEFVESDPADDQAIPLGDALQELAADVDIDPVESVREVREQR